MKLMQIDLISNIRSFIPEGSQCAYVPPALSLNRPSLIASLSCFLGSSTCLPIRTPPTPCFAVASRKRWKMARASSSSTSRIRAAQRASTAAMQPQDALTPKGRRVPRQLTAQPTKDMPPFDCFTLCYVFGFSTTERCRISSRDLPCGKRSR